MFAIVKDGAITQTASSVRQMFPNTSFAGSPNADFLRENNVMDVVNGEKKNDQYYFVTPGDLTLVDGVPTQAYTNTAKALEDADAKDKDGNQVYVQVWDASANGGKGAMVDTSEKLVNRGLKTSMTEQVKKAANSYLANTDWMVIRKAERDVAIPSATATYRAAVLTECTRLESAIDGAGDVDALQTVMAGQNWPKES